jgi:asparagine N-glycosylation enzyme membrane subunit Stt3
VAKSLQLKYAIWLSVLMNWGAVAYAAENPLVEGLESIPLKAVGYVLALSIIGGTAGTLTKIARPDIVVRNLPLEITKDMIASLVAGLLVFFFTSWWSTINFWLQAALVTMAGYGGSKVLDMMLIDGAMPWFKNFMQRVFNVAPKDGST